MAKAPNTKKAAKRTLSKRAATKKGTPSKSTPISQTAVKREKNAFEKNFGEGTAFDLDYGKLLIIALCIYIAVNVS